MKRVTTLLLICVTVSLVLVLAIVAPIHEQPKQMIVCWTDASEEHEKRSLGCIPNEASFAMGTMLKATQEGGKYMGLTETKESYEEEILSREGVLGIGVGRDSIVVYVDADKEISPPIPMTLDEWPVVLIPTEPFEIL